MGARLKTLAVVVLCLGIGAAAIAPASANWGADPATREWPTWPYRTSCSYNQSFDPVAVFSQPAVAELGSTPGEKALRRFLKDPLINWVPRHNYRLLREDVREAVFISSPLSSSPRQAPEVLTFTRRKGHWRWSGSGPCVPTSIIDGRPAIGWDLAYGKAPLDPKTTTIEVQLGPGECASGQSQNARAHPVFAEVEGKLLLTIWLSPPKGRGGQTCVGISEPPLKVKLPAPLGDRELFDGGSYPPHPALAAGRFY